MSTGEGRSINRVISRSPGTVVQQILGPTIAGVFSAGPERVSGQGTGADWG